jgi:putative transposase
MNMGRPDHREERGMELAQANNVTRINANSYRVKSQNGNEVYSTFKDGDEWRCTCPDYRYRHVKCKHIFAVQFSSTIRKEVETKRVIQEVNVQNCQYCGSTNLKKDGIRRNKAGAIQKFYCRDCHHYFTINIGFERMKHNPQAITSAMQLYFSGESLRNTQKSLRLLGVEVSYRTILNWINKYVKLMKNYVEKIVPNVSDTWRADELWVKIKGDMKYLFALIDDETRFWIAQEVAETKFQHDARHLFEMGRELMGKRPLTLITDGLPAYHEAYKKEFWTQQSPRTEHINAVHFRGDRNNNKMERFNGELRDREKVMRGLKTKDTPILAGYLIFHNYIRPHEGLQGKTPSEACGISIEGKNKWITLIQNASQEIQKN